MEEEISQKQEQEESNQENEDAALPEGRAGGRRGETARQTAVDRLPQQIGQRELLVQPLSRVTQLLLDELFQQSGHRRKPLALIGNRLSRKH